MAELRLSSALASVFPIDVSRSHRNKMFDSDSHPELLYGLAGPAFTTDKKIRAVATCQRSPLMPKAALGVSLGYGGYRVRGRLVMWLII